MVYQQFRQQSRIENNVTVVADERVVALIADGRGIHVTTLGFLRQQLLQEFIAESLLKLNVGLAGMQPLGNCIRWHVGIKIGQHLLKLWVGQQSIEHFRQLFGLERTDGVEFGWDMHDEVLELIFYNFGQHVGDVQTCGAYLLWNKAGWCHARSGVHLEHVHHVLARFIFGDDVVNANDAVAL